MSREQPRRAGQASVAEQPQRQAALRAFARQRQEKIDARGWALQAVPLQFVEDRVLDLVLVEPGVAVRIDEPQIGKPVVVERRQVADLDDAAGVQNFARLGSELNGEWQFRLQSA